MTHPDARAISGWRYGPGYALHDLRADDAGPMMDPRFQYHAIRAGDALAGFACFGEDARVGGGPYAGKALDIGCGLAPERCGKGEGPAFVAAVIAFAERHFAPPLLRLSVPERNERAKRVYLKAGFSVVRRFAGLTRSGTHPFLLMTRPAGRGVSAAGRG